MVNSQNIVRWFGVIGVILIVIAWIYIFFGMLSGKYYYEIGFKTLNIILIVTVIYYLGAYINKKRKKLKGD